MPIDDPVGLWDKALDFFMVQGPAVTFAMSIAFGSSWWTVKVLIRGIQIGMRQRKDQDVEGTGL